MMLLSRSLTLFVLLQIVLHGASLHGADAVPTVRVMSFNIRYGTAKDGADHWDNRKEFLLDTIRNFEPDLLGTQETLAFQRDYLQEKLVGFEHFAAGRDDGKNEGEMAALYYRKSKYEKLEGGHFWLSETPEVVGSKGWDAALPRIATWVKLKDLQTPTLPPVLFLNTHFDHRGRVARAEGAALIRRKLLEIGQGCRLIVTGDFNAGEGSGPYQSLFANSEQPTSPLVDTFRVRYPQRGPEEGTFNAFKPGNTKGDRIDWIACSQDFEVRLAGIDRTVKDGRVPSDHFPVTAVLRPIVPGVSPALRVLCYNIHHGRGMDDVVDLVRLAKVINATDPDLVALQEVDRNTMRTSGIDQTAELARLTGLYSAFGKAIDYQGGDYGQAILSRFPMTEPKVFTLPGEPDREQRIAFAVKVPIEDEEVTFVTTHLHHQSDEFRQRQAENLNEIFGTTKRVILAGDLNANPDSKPLAIISQVWQNATSKPGLLSFPATKPAKQIDYIMYRDQADFETVDAYVLDEAIASDHRPIFALIRPMFGNKENAGKAPAKAFPPYTKQTLIAHRGASFDAPEHTLEAYQLALDHGADYVEPDLQLTKDNVLICLHDATLERTTDVAKKFPERAVLRNGRKTWPVSQFTFAEIQTLDAGSWKGEKFTGCKVASLQQMIDLVRGKAGIIPETKNPDAYKATGQNMEAELMALLKRNGLDKLGADPKTPVVIQSFSEASLKSLREDHDCNLPLILTIGAANLTTERLTEIAKYAQGIAPAKQLVLARPELVQQAHELNLSVTIWTCRAGQTGQFANVREEMAHYLKELKVDAIFTDNPDQFPR